MLKFVLLVNKQGQTRLSQYYEYVPVEERVTTEADIVRKCLARNEDSVITSLTSLILSGWLVRLCAVLVHGVQELQGGISSLRLSLLHSRRG